MDIFRSDYMKRFVMGGVVSAAATLTAGLAAAQGIGQSEPGQLDLQTPVTQVGRQIVDLHEFMLYIMAGICAFVIGLLIWVAIRYNSASNPKPARWTHNTLIEVIWTGVPIIILIIIAIPSIKLLQLEEDFSKVEPDIVVKATGRQWYWSYQYPDEELEFDAYMLGKGYAQMTDDVRAELANAGYPEKTWKLATDTALVVPVNKTVLVQVTASDVIHAWAVPAFGVKADAVPGRLNQTWFNAEQEGIYFGQCSELCGLEHSYMPITVKVVSQAEYDAWLTCAKESDVIDCATPSHQDLAERSRRGLNSVETANAAGGVTSER